jgi:tetratricopeptide (TPR) repeat protein
MPEFKQQRGLMDTLGLDATVFEEAAQPVQKDQEQDLQPIWCVPYHRTPFFTGRDDILSALHAALESETAAALTQAVSGLGGIGKTQTALEYANRYSQHYKAVLWVRADSQDTLNADYTALATFLHLPIQDESDQDLIVCSIKRWLSDQSGWLLILDNVEDFRLVRDFLPATRQGHVLLTTRAQDTGGLAKTIEVAKMPQDEGALLLLRRAEVLGPDEPLDRTSHPDLALAQLISRTMDGLPLALVQAGAYIKATGCDMASYLERYEKQRVILLARRDEFNVDYPASVATTWSLSFEKVEQDNAAAADILRVCAFLHPDAIPEEMIIGNSTFLGPFLQAITDDIQLDDCMRALRRYSLIQRNTREKTFSIHRLVQAVQMDNLGQETQHLWATRAVYAVNRLFPYVEPGTTQPGQRFILHAQACCQLITQRHLASLDAAQLLHKTGRYLRETSQYPQAELLCQQALQLYETLPQAPQVQLSHCCTDLALVAERRGKFPQAEVLYGRAWELCERLYGTEHPETAAALNNLGVFYLGQGRYTQAESHFKQALGARIKTLGPDDLQVANSQQCLAEVYSHRGMDAKAEQLYRQVLDLRERVLGPAHPGVGNVLNNLAGVCAQQGHLDEAELLARRTLALYEHHLGTEHHFVAYPLATLSSICRQQGKTAEAEALLKRSLHIREQALGADHRDVAIALTGLALLSQTTGRLHDAEDLYRRALAILEKTAGPEDPHVINTLCGLAVIYNEQGKYTEAEQLIERLLALAARLQGLEHGKVLNDLLILGTSYLDRSEYGKARSLYERMVAVATKVLGHDHSAVVTLQINVARACENQGDFFTANRLYYRTLQEIQQKWGLEHHSAAPTLLQWYSSLLKKHNRHEEAAHVDAIMERIRKISGAGNTPQ